MNDNTKKKLKKSALIAAGIIIPSIISFKAGYDFGSGKADLGLIDKDPVEEVIETSEKPNEIFDIIWDSVEPSEIHGDDHRIYFLRTADGKDIKLDINQGWPACDLTVDGEEYIEFNDRYCNGSLTVVRPGGSDPILMEDLIVQGRRDYKAMYKQDLQNILNGLTNPTSYDATREIIEEIKADFEPNNISWSGDSNYFMRFPSGEDTRLVLRKDGICILFTDSDETEYKDLNCDGILETKRMGNADINLNEFIPETRASLQAEYESEIQRIYDALSNPEEYNRAKILTDEFLKIAVPTEREDISGRSENAFRDTYKFNTLDAWVTVIHEHGDSALKNGEPSEIWELYIDYHDEQMRVRYDDINRDGFLDYYNNQIKDMTGNPNSFEEDVRGNIREQYITDLQWLLQMGEFQKEHNY